MENNRTYHIIGAGIAGLYTAKLLKQKHPSAKIILYESSDRVGGRCGSAYSSKLDCQTDYATHVVLNCNTLAKKLLGNDKFVHPIRFWDFPKQSFVSIRHCLKESELAVFNTSHPDWRAKIFLYRKLFPFIGLRAYFSDGNLIKDLCSSLTPYADKIRFGWVWNDYRSKDGHLSRLIFNHGEVRLNKNDVVISAIDSYHYHRLFGGYDFEYNAIDNIFYRTSMALSLPSEVKMLGLIDAQSQWFFSSPQYFAVTISNVSHKPDERLIWQEICHLRNYNAAFFPICQARHFPRATIKQDAKNNRMRPDSPRTQFQNLYICGDWTMKNRPCCIETALESACRVTRYLPR